MLTFFSGVLPLLEVVEGGGAELEGATGGGAEGPGGGA